MKHLLTLPAFLFFSLSAFSQDSIPQQLVRELCAKIELVIGDDWFVQPTGNGMDVYFCRSCHERFLQWKEQDTSSVLKERSDFFRPELADSVSFYSYISQPPHYFRDSVSEDQYLKNLYPKNGILKFRIRLEPKWSRTRTKQVAEQNEMLAEAIKKGRLTKTNLHMFSDYRFWVPDVQWQWEDRIKDYDFDFERLPYRSARYNYSFFFEQDKPFFMCDVVYVDSSDPRYYANPDNFIEEERCITLKLIALMLGISDFELVDN